VNLASTLRFEGLGSNFSVTERPDPRPHDSQSRLAMWVGTGDLSISGHPIVRVRDALLRGEKRQDGT